MKSNTKKFAIVAAIVAAVISTIPAYAGVQTTCYYSKKGFTYVYPKDQACPAYWVGKVDGKAVKYAFVKRIVTRF